MAQLGEHLDWILFDADHTLLDFDRSAHHALHHVLELNGKDLSEDQVNLYYRFNKQCWQEYERGLIDRETLARKRFELFFEAVGIDDMDPWETNRVYLAELPKHPYFLDQAMDLLERVRGHFKMGIITNGLKEVQRPRLQKTGIEGFFDVIVVSGEIGLAKPDGAFFQYAHDEMKHPTKDKVMVVGDSIYSDMLGGIDFGYRTCWYNPARSEAPDDIIPEYQVHSHKGLMELLGL